MLRFLYGAVERVVMLVELRDENRVGAIGGGDYFSFHNYVMSRRPCICLAETQRSQRQGLKQGTQRKSLRSLRLCEKKIIYLLKILNSVLLFSCRPSSVSFVAIGCSSP